MTPAFHPLIQDGGNALSASKTIGKEIFYLKKSSKKFKAAFLKTSLQALPFVGHEIMFSKKVQSSQYEFKMVRNFSELLSVPKITYL